jgi:putative membrane protein
MNRSSRKAVISAAVTVGETAMSQLKIACAITLLAGASSCAGGEQPSAPAARAERSAPRPSAAAMPASTYVTRAASIDLFVIGSSKLALQRSTSPRVRDFARSEIRSHEGLGAQLSLAGRRLNLLPSATLLPEHQAMLNQLQATSDFDGTYRRQQQAIHQQALTLHANYSARGKSPTLKPVAAAAAQTIRAHLSLANRL